MDFGYSKSQAIKDIRVAAGGGDRRFLVPQYEAGNPTDCGAARTKTVALTKLFEGCDVN